MTNKAEIRPKELSEKADSARSIVILSCVPKRTISDDTTFFFFLSFLQVMLKNEPI